MKTILVTQRVDLVADYDERRDALDQDWVALVQEAGLVPELVPNNRAWVERRLAAGPPPPLLLTGGDSLAVCGGLVPERDQVEGMLLEAALAGGVPVLGVCRGMQVIQDHFGGKLERVPGHVADEQEIEIEGRTAVVNSYHEWGSREAPAGLKVWARAADGVVKAVRHSSLPVWGIMWHPERIHPFRREDLDLLRRVLDPQETP